ncbi:hypothetical protein GWI33_018225 [Rhynchophorus ferrugineus]|uniref:Uncharacterized protein n=1 Tax=Rhynchophorus ferrugineus TaxID=354439 RepID=A0A834HU67_RHYFE|nr:hypothetical protein GWI33_018225 [Rhynchophorus ferrugineus]
MTQELSGVGDAIDQSVGFPMMASGIRNIGNYEPIDWLLERESPFETTAVGTEMRKKSNNTIRFDYGHQWSATIRASVFRTVIYIIPEFVIDLVLFSI